LLWESSASTLSAPDSSPRKARNAEVSTTYLLKESIFSLSFPEALFEQQFHQAFFARSAKSPNRISEDGYDPRRGAFNNPFEPSVRANVKLLSDLWRNYDISVFGGLFA
jgi:hypothetical protein